MQTVDTNTRMRILLFLISLIIFGCADKHKTDSDNILDTYLSNPNLKRVNDTLVYPFHGATYKVVIDSNSRNGRVRKVFGYLGNNPSLYSGYFKFNADGRLDKYYFMAGDGEHDLYRITYNPAKVRYEEQGNSFVDYMAPNVITDSANDYTFVFSTFPRRFVEAFYSVDHERFNKISLTTQEAVPFIADGEIILTKKEVEQGILIKVKARDMILPLKGLAESLETVDTIQFK